MTPAPRVSVVVPSRDRPGPLSRCLAALEAQTIGEYEVVVVDDGSTDAEAVAAAVRRAPHARLVRAAGRGPAAARNVGAAAARAPVVCFTDDDCRPSPGWAAALARRLDGPDAPDAVAGPTGNGRPDDVYAAASQAVTNHLTAAGLDRTTGRLTFAPTSNLACRTSTHRTLPFDETYPLAAGEDREWCTRLTSQGRTLVFEPWAWVAHDQDLSLRRFWRQQARYGRGARRWQRDRPPGERLQPARFYADLVRAGFAAGPAAGALVLLAQLATASGIATEVLLQGLRERDGSPSFG